MSGYNPERAKARRDARREQGICTTCGKRPAFGHFVQCPYCIEKGALYNARSHIKNREKINERQRENRRKVIDAGICPCCRKPNPDTSRVWCPKCRAKAHAQFIRNYVHKVRPDGICLRCNRPTEPGRKLCEVHRMMAAEAGQKGRDAQNRSKHPWRLDEDIRRTIIRERGN